MRGGTDRAWGARRERDAPMQLGLLDDARVKPYGPQQAPVLIRSSRRARCLTLRVVPPFQIELVVPRGCRPADVEAFLSSSRAWIRRTQAELAARYPAARRELPARIALEAVGTAWDVDVRLDTAREPTLESRAQRLVLRVPASDPGAGFEPLRRWLLAQGRRYLRSWLADEARAIGVAPRRVQIRTQRTRWGSCSEHGTVSLNAALLLLPRRLVRYLLVHELCHLRHLDHSRRFWTLVGKHDPDYRAHDTALGAAWSEIPAWALPR